MICLLALQSRWNHFLEYKWGFLRTLWSFSNVLTENPSSPLDKSLNSLDISAFDMKKWILCCFTSEITLEMHYTYAVDWSQQDLDAIRLCFWRCFICILIWRTEKFAKIFCNQCLILWLSYTLYLSLLEVNNQ